MNAGRSECKFCQVTATHVYLRLRHTTSKIKDFPRLSVYTARLVKSTSQFKRESLGWKSILYLLHKI